MGKNETRRSRCTSRSSDPVMRKRPVESSERSCTLRDVARLAGVSTATVSRVLNGSGLVTDKTRGRVMLVIAGLKYRPSPHASELGRQNRGIPRKKTYSVDALPYPDTNVRGAAKAKSREAA